MKIRKLFKRLLLRLRLIEKDDFDRILETLLLYLPEFEIKAEDKGFIRKSKNNSVEHLGDIHTLDIFNDKEWKCWSMLETDKQKRDDR